MEIWPGQPYPLGASYDGFGTNFAVHSEAAERIELCLFDHAGRETRKELPEVSAYTWHGYLPQVGPGQRYGYRAYGPFQPDQGHWFNPNKLLLDPYAKAISGKMTWDLRLFDYEPDGITPNFKSFDTAPFVPKGVISNPHFNWGDDCKPNIPWEETVIYETHVRGFSKLNHGIPEALRGSYAGLAHPASIRYLKRLGVTAVELLPVHHFLTEPLLADRGKSNYWGYNTLGYFAPHAGYCSSGSLGEQINEFKHMVRELHAAGLEVLVDVVYNHTAEGGRGGPTLSFRGLDNAHYYRLDPNNPLNYVDFTGCGNTLDMTHPYVLQLLMDSLRYWVTEMRVDGFRFDLASALAREGQGFDKLSAFFDLVQQDPILRSVKLIAEPWDLGLGGYQVGNFPAPWAEWNGRYRDTMRDFWRGQDNSLGEFASRLTGSSDLYKHGGRSPHASVNFITAHDGFTLRDMVSYNHKHNLDNGEGNRDGESHNRSWNCGAEGETTRKDVLALRRRQQRNFLTTLILSQGVPMLTMGDETGRTQRGNNNAYCQDNELSWLSWQQNDCELFAFTRALLRLRAKHPVFRHGHFFRGAQVPGSQLPDVGWFRPDGLEMTDADWRTHYAKSVGVFFNGLGLETKNRHGQPITGRSFLVFFNAGHEDVYFTIPRSLTGEKWQDELYSTWTTPDAPKETFLSGKTVRVDSRSVRVLVGKALSKLETTRGAVPKSRRLRLYKYA